MEINVSADAITIYLLRYLSQVSLKFVVFKADNLTKLYLESILFSKLCSYDILINKYYYLYYKCIVIWK